MGAGLAQLSEQLASHRAVAFAGQIENQLSELGSLKTLELERAREPSPGT